MVSDDLTALTAISMGALVPAALTLSLLTHDPAPASPLQVDVAPTRSMDSCVGASAGIVDFAIIRSVPATTDAQNPPESARDPGTRSLQLRLLHAR
jgi:hypothetical protein